MIDRIDRKREVLVHVAKYCFEGTLEAHKEFIPLEIVPHGSQPTHRCCVYREREVLRNRVDWPAAARPCTTAKTTTPSPISRSPL